MNKINYLIIFLILTCNFSIVIAVPPTPIPDAENIVFIDLLQHGNDKELIVFQDGIYYGTFNYSEPILFNPNVNYTIVLNEDYIDLMQDETFFTQIFTRYGNILISVSIIIMIIGVLMYILSRMKK